VVLECQPQIFGDLRGFQYLPAWCAVTVRAVRNVGAARALLARNVEAPSRTARREPSAPWRHRLSVPVAGSRGPSPLNSDKLGDRFSDMRSVPSALLPILRSQVAGDLLALLYLHPEAEYSLTEAATTIGASLNAVHYEAGKLSESGLISTRRRGNLRLVRAVTDSLLSRPLTDLLAVTYGPLPVLTDLLADVEGIAEAYIYGSWAARYRGEPGPAPADVDILVVGTADPDDLDDVAERAQRTLHRPVSIRRVRPETWNVANPTDPFLRSVKTRPLVRIGRGAA
jgi:predicted nucleotidyltransferase